MPENEKELEQEVEKILEEYEINPNTIRYYSNVERFFRAFTPKIIGTGSLFATSGLALAAIIGGAVTGGLGFIPAIVAGSVAGVATATSAVATISLGVDAATVSRARYKNLGVKDTKELVEKMESEAYGYTQKLAELEQSGEKSIKLKDGNYYSARQLKKLIQGYEKEAYQGVKYLMKQAEKNTEKVENLRRSKNLTDNQKKEQAILWNELELIGECARNITSKRNDINPYKNVIVNALHKGCLIGRNDRENGEIRKHKIYKKINLTEELYHNMYEKNLLETNPPKQQLDEENVASEEIKLTRKEKKAEKVRDLKKQIRELEARNAELVEANARKEEQRRGAIQRGWDQRAKAKYYQGKMEEVEDNLAGVIMANYAENKVKDTKAAEDSRLIAKLTKAYERNVKRSLTQKETIQDLEAQKDALIDEVDEKTSKLNKAKGKLKRAANLVTDWIGRGKKAEEEAKANKIKVEALEGEVRSQVNARHSAEATANRERDRRISAETKVTTANKTIDEQNTQINQFVMAQQENISSIVDLQVENDSLKQQKDYWQTRAVNAEDTVGAIYTTSEALDRSVAALQAELNSIQDEKTSNLEKANATRQKNSTLRKIAEVWSHVKIAQNEDAKKYADSTGIVIQALDIAVDRYKIASSEGNLDEIKQIRNDLQNVYDIQRRVDKEHTWPPYLKDTRKIIKGTPVPDSPQDENYLIK